MHAGRKMIGKWFYIESRGLLACRMIVTFIGAPVAVGNENWKTYSYHVRALYNGKYIVKNRQNAVMVIRRLGEIHLKINCDRRGEQHIVISWERVVNWIPFGFVCLGFSSFTFIGLDLYFKL